jgi:Spy/CpxP family protein refolding chaperone
MDEQDKNAAAEQDESAKDRRCCGRHCCGRRPWWAKLIVLAAIIGAVFAWHAYGHDGDWWHSRSHAFNEPSSAQMHKHAESMTGHILDRVNATDVQRQKAMTIARAAADDLQPLIEAHRAARASLYSALTAETIDPARLEQLRSEALHSADTVSRRLTQEIADMAAVLTPAQRRELMARWAPQLGA